MNPVILLDGHLKSSLAAARALGKRGISVCVGAERATAMALHTKHASSVFVYTSPRRDQEAFLAEVRSRAMECLNASSTESSTESAFESSTAATSEHGKPIVMCFSDATHMTIARAYDDLKDVLLFSMPQRDQFERGFDKSRTYALAAVLGIPTIRSYTRDDFDSVSFPAVVKPCHSVAWNAGKSASGTAEFVFSRKELDRRVSKMTERAGEAPIVQEFILGEERSGEYGVELLCDNGTILLEFAHQRIRSLSPRGGAAVVKQTAPPTPEVSLMRGYAKDLMEALSWTGPVMVEFKTDRRDGSVRLMEINGRFWGSLPLPLTAGVDFVYGAYLLALGRGHAVEAGEARHVRTFHFLGDVKCLLSILLKNDPLRELLYPSRGRAVWDFVTEIFRGTPDVHSFQDPMPAFYEVKDVISRGVK